MTSRRRALVMLGAAAVCAGLSVSAVDRYAGDVEAQVGGLVTVVVATRDLPARRVLTPGLAAAVLAERRVPQRFMPPGVLHSRNEAVGLEAVAGLAAGDYVRARELRPPRGSSGRPDAGRWSRNTRVVEVSVSGTASLSGVLHPGTLVDVLITTERGGVAGRTFLALQRVPVVGFEAGSADSLDGEAPVDGRVTLRATLRQAVLLTAADNFAREVRLVPRAAGDMRRLAPVAVTARGLGP